MQIFGMGFVIREKMTRCSWIKISKQKQSDEQNFVKQKSPFYGNDENEK